MGMPEEIKNCPFCGKAAVGIHRTDDGFWWVRCFVCDAVGPRRWKMDEIDKTSAVKAWNTRVQRTV